MNMIADNKIRVLCYNKFWNNEDESLSRLDIPDFEFLTEKQYQTRIKEGKDVDIDAIIFHIPTLSLTVDELVELKTKDQLWVYWSFESVEHFPIFKDPEIKRLFDVTATFQLDADISMPYVKGMGNSWQQPPVKKTQFVNAFFSSDWDKSGRYSYLKELMSHIKVDSFGRVFNNKRTCEDSYKKVGDSGKSVAYKMNLITQYKFTLAFENAIENDYVTEKFFHPLIVGSVPVYLGAPNVEEFAPGEKCFINVKDFSSAGQLAEYLRMLDGSDSLYNEYLTWKLLPLKTSFESKIATTDPPVSKLLYHLRRKVREVRMTGN